MGQGGWFYVTDPLRGNPGKRAIITGTYANDHSPGASHYTSAEVYDMADPEDTDAFRVECERLENLPEWADDDENDDDENDDEG